jgi:predicted MPP superfamily phosphohydrolase
MTAPPLQAAGLIIGSILLTCGLHFLLWRRLIIKALPTPPKHAGLMFAGLAALFPIGMVLLLLMRQLPRWLNSPLMTTVFTWLGLSIFLFWAVIAFEILRLVFRLSGRMQTRLARLSIAAAVAVTIYAVIQANARPRVVTTQFAATSELAGYRIVLLTDLHIGHTSGRNFANMVVQIVNPLNADLIAIGGDMVDGSVPALAPEIAPLQQLRAKDGVVFILGNHEYLSGAEPWVHHVESYGWHVLRNERLSLPRLDVIGLDEAPPLDIRTLLLRRHGRVPASASDYAADQNRPTVLVAHEPAAFIGACDGGIDLALAGHTHGGQIFPFGIVDWMQDGYLAGPYQCGNTHLYVSSGAGFWGPPMRLGTHNEVSLIEFVGVSDNAATGL